MSQSTLWERVKTGGKSGFDKTWRAMDKLGAPVNKLSNKLGSEAFWPTTLDKESDKAARILKTFCKDGFYAEEDYQTEDGPKQRQKVVKKIPTKVIQNAKGLAIFTTMRSGLWVSGAGGSGILIARKEDGSWSPPSGIMLHTAGLGFLVGIDIYDCVVVINTWEGLEAFTKIRCTLGSEVSVAAGPIGAGGILDTELHRRQAAIFTYLKSRGFYAGIEIAGTVIIERTDENERFYGQKIPVKEILAGKVKHPPYEIRRLLETIKSAQGDADVDESILPTEAPPSDYEIDDGHVFGVPAKEDPDPYGVLALEKEGMSIKEAATQKRASWEAFSFNPSLRSPLHSVYTDRRRSGSQPLSARNSLRMSTAAGNEPKTPSSLRNSMDLSSPRTPILMSDMSTQTDDLPDPPSAERRTPGTEGVGGSSFSTRTSLITNDGHDHMLHVPEHEVLETSPERMKADNADDVDGFATPPEQAITPRRTEDNEEDEAAGDVHIGEPVVQSINTIQTSATPQVITKARLVSVPKRAPPILPPRNPNRSAGPVVIDASPIGSEVQTESTDSKHDSAHEAIDETDKHANGNELNDQMENVKFDADTSDDDEITRPDPWERVAEAKARETEMSETHDTQRATSEAGAVRSPDSSLASVDQASS